MRYFIARNSSCGKVIMFSHACVIPIVHGRGVSASRSGGCLPLGPGGCASGSGERGVHPLDTPTPDIHPRDSHTPPWTHPQRLTLPGRSHPPVNKRVVRILLECFSVCDESTSTEVGHLPCSELENATDLQGSG